MIPQYEPIERRPNPMKHRNPLQQKTSKIITIQDRLDELQSFKKWQRLVAEYQKKGIKLNPKLRPLVKMVKLGQICIDEDIQRALDSNHCTKITDIKNFKPQLLQVVYCIKIPGKEEYHAVDGQHSITLLAALIDAGVFEGEDTWKEVEVPVLYIETDSRAFARKAFALINGKGKKKISLWYEHRTKVLSVRIDGSDDPDDIRAEKKQSICERHECYPVDKESSFVGMPGTFTHIDESLSLDDEILEVACRWHNTYFHRDEINGSLWFLIGDIYKSFDSAKIPLTDEFLEELAGILQQYFSGLAEFHSAAHKAHSKWSNHVYQYKMPWEDKSIACVLVQLYKLLGGTHRVPQHLLDRGDEIVKFLDDDIKNLFAEKKAA